MSNAFDKSSATRIILEQHGFGWLSVESVANLSLDLVQSCCSVVSLSETMLVCCKF